jgi:hypothetical protein
MGEHVKSVIHNTIGSLLSTALLSGGIVLILWLKGLALQWALLVAAGVMLTVAVAANFVSLIVSRHRKRVSSESESEAIERIGEHNDKLQGELHLAEREIATLKGEKGRLTREMAKLQRETQWLTDIAQDQRQTIHRFVHFTDLRYGRHELMRSEPYLDLCLTVDNRSLFDISFLGLDGTTRFGQRELTVAPIWQSRSTVTHGNIGTVTVRQPLTKEDVIHILNSPSDIEAGFDLSELRIGVEGNHGLNSTAVNVHQTPLSNAQLLGAYSDLDIDIIRVVCDWSQDTRTAAPYVRSESFFVTLLLRIKSQRATPLAIETFKLFLTVNGKEHVSFAEDEVHARRIVNEQGAEYGDGAYSPSLSKNGPVTLIQDKTVEGPLQFIFSELQNMAHITGAITVYDAPFTLCLIDQDSRRFTHRGFLPSEAVRFVNPSYKNSLTQ